MGSYTGLEATVFAPAPYAEVAAQIADGHLFQRLDEFDLITYGEIPSNESGSPDYTSVNWLRIDGEALSEGFQSNSNYPNAGFSKLNVNLADEYTFDGGWSGDYSFIESFALHSMPLHSLLVYMEGEKETFGVESLEELFSAHPRLLPQLINDDLNDALDIEISGDYEIVGTNGEFLHLLMRKASGGDSSALNGLMNDIEALHKFKEHDGGTGAVFANDDVNRGVTQLAVQYAAYQVAKDFSDNDGVLSLSPHGLLIDVKAITEAERIIEREFEGLDLLEDYVRGLSGSDDFSNLDNIVFQSSSVSGVLDVGAEGATLIIGKRRVSRQQPVWASLG